MNAFPPLIQINPDSIRMGMLPFSLFLKEGGSKLSKFCEKGSSVTTSHFQNLRDKASSFWVPNIEIETYYRYIFKKIDDVVANKMLEDESKVKLVHDLGSEVMGRLLHNPADEAYIELCFQFVLSMLKLLKNVKDSLFMLLELNGHKDYLLSHSISTSIFTLLLAKEFVYDETKLANVVFGGLLLDIGMTKVEKDVLFKEEKLSDEEWDIIRQHSVLGREILEAHDVDEVVMEIVTYHHERIDGSGYPFGLAGTEIDFAVRIAAVADVYDALTSKRDYRDANAHFRALQIMAKERKLYDSKVFEALLRIVLKDEALISKFMLL
jgi:putative nucleotidyltransferase with HDIG domain